MKRTLLISVILVAFLSNACAPSHQGMVRYNDQWLTQEEYVRMKNTESPVPAPTAPAPVPTP